MRKKYYPMIAVALMLSVATVSNADKAKIYGALGYFLLPLDILPDFIPMAGYTDDLTAVIWALHTVWKNITPEIKAQAAAKTAQWFGDFDQAAADEQLGK